MLTAEIPQKDLGRTQAFLSYDSLEEVNAIDTERQFRYHPTDKYFTPSATFHNRALMLGVGPSSRAICDELKSRGYIGIVEIETINPRHGVNQIRGRPVVPA